MRELLLPLLEWLIIGSLYIKTCRIFFDLFWLSFMYSWIVFHRRSDENLTKNVGTSSAKPVKLNCIETKSSVYKVVVLLPIRFKNYKLLIVKQTKLYEVVYGSKMMSFWERQTLLEEIQFDIKLRVNKQQPTYIKENTKSLIHSEPTTSHLGRWSNSLFQSPRPWKNSTLNSQ